MKAVLIIASFVFCFVANAATIIDSYKKSAELGFDFSDIPHDIGLWLDASDTATLWQTSDCSTTAITTDAQTVKCWEDKSDNSYDLINASSTQVYTASGIGSKPTITFDGSSNLREASVNPQDIVGSAKQYTMFFVLNPENTTAATLNIGENLNDSTSAVIVFLAFNNGLFLDGGTYPSDRTSVAEPTGWDSSDHIVEIQRDGATQKIWVDGSLLVTDATATGDNVSSSSKPLTLGEYAGGAFRWSGDWSFLIIYKGALSDSEREEVTDELNTRYGGIF